MAVKQRIKVRRAYQGPSCPRCASTLDVAARATGPARCRRCGIRYEAVAFAPIAEAGALIALPVGALGESTPCAKHARNSAEASCSRCGTFMCGLCRIDGDGMVLCPGCFDRLASEGALPSARRTYRDDSRVALALAVIALLFTSLGLGLVLGPFAIWYGARGLRSRRRLGLPISKARCVVAIVMGALEVLLAIVFILALLGLLYRARGTP